MHLSSRATEILDGLTPVCWKHLRHWSHFRPRPPVSASINGLTRAIVLRRFPSPAGSLAPRRWSGWRRKWAALTSSCPRRTWTSWRPSSTRTPPSASGEQHHCAASLVHWARVQPLMQSWGHGSVLTTWELMQSWGHGSVLYSLPLCDPSCATTLPSCMSAARVLMRDSWASEGFQLSAPVLNCLCCRYPKAHMASVHDSRKAAKVISEGWM